MEEPRNPEPPAEPGALRVMFLLARLAVRRWLNRFVGYFAALFGRRELRPARTGTARKSHVSVALMFSLAILCIFNSLNMSTQFLRRLSSEAEARHGESRQQIAVSRDAYRAILDVEETVRDLDKAHLKPVREIFEKNLRSMLRQEVHRQSLRERMIMPDETELQSRVARLMQVFHEKGSEGFMPQRAQEVTPFPSTEDWPSSEDEGLVRNALGLILLLLSFSLICMALGSGNQDLGRLEWHLEWLFSFPVSAHILFLTKALEYALLNPFNWFVVIPLFFTLFWASGFGWWSVPLAVVASFYLSTLMGALRIASETWLRKHLSVSRLKDVQAGFTVLSLLTFFLVMGLAIAPQLPKHLVDWSTHLPATALWNPLSLPVLLFGSPPNPWAWVAMGGWMLGLPLVAALFSAFCVRDGLLVSANPYQGVRSRAPTNETGLLAGLKGLVGKDLRLLFRDRNMLVQTLVFPVLIISFNVLINPTMLTSVLSDFKHAATLAFSLGAYVLLFSGFSVLTAEGRALWLLYTFPQHFDAMLRRKATLWSAFGLLYAGGVLAVAGILSPDLEASFLITAGTVLAGVVIYAYIAVALGALGTDPFEIESARRLRPQLTYLYMFLAGLFAFAIYAPTLWGKLVQTVLSALLAAALWQKVRDRLPYLLDPTEAPPPQVSIADGLIAALAFFVLQGVLLLGLMRTPLPPGAQMLYAFAGAGLLVALRTLYRLWRRKVPHLLATLGLRKDPANPHSSWFFAPPVGLACGLAAAFLALLYLLAVETFPSLRTWRDEMVKGNSLFDVELKWFVWTAVIAAPLCEEFIFRGLVFRGLRRTFGGWRSILASALIFALVHPPMAALPVFGLGLAAALSFELTGLLIAPVMAHMIYNLVVVLASG